MLAPVRFNVRGKRVAAVRDVASAHRLASTHGTTSRLAEASDRNPASFA